MKTWLNASFGWLDEGPVGMTYMLSVGDVIVTDLENCKHQITLMCYRCLCNLPFKVTWQTKLVTCTLLGPCPS